MLRLYTQNNCVYCEMMKQKLDMWGHDYKIINISNDLEAKKFLRNRNHKTVPVLYDKNGLFHLNVVDTNDFTQQVLEEELKSISEPWPERAECDFGWRQPRDTWR